MNYTKAYNNVWRRIWGDQPDHNLLHSNSCCSLLYSLTLYLTSTNLTNTTDNIYASNSLVDGTPQLKIEANCVQKMSVEFYFLLNKEGKNLESRWQGTNAGYLLLNSFFKLSTLTYFFQIVCAIALVDVYLSDPNYCCLTYHLVCIMLHFLDLFIYDWLHLTAKFSKWRHSLL